MSADEELMNSKLGRVDLPLKEYNMMRDTLTKLLENTKTHKEFIKEFRTSLLQIVTLAEAVGLDLNPMIEYYQYLDFKEITKIDINYIPSPEQDGVKTAQPRFILTIKTVEDERKGLNTINH